LFLKVVAGVVQNLTESVGPSIQDALPHHLEHGESARKPLSVPTDPDNHKLVRFPIFARTVLHKITLFQVCNLELELNLGQIVFRDARVNLSGQGTLDFDEDTIFRDAIG
jgi:hypothetical protein